MHENQNAVGEESAAEYVRRKVRSERDLQAEALARKKLAQDLAGRKPAVQIAVSRPKSVVQTKQKPGFEAQLKKRAAPALTPELVELALKRVHNLTNRERAIFIRCAPKIDKEAIGNAIGVSPGTIGVQLSILIGKLGFRELNKSKRFEALAEAATEYNKRNEWRET